MTQEEHFDRLLWRYRQTGLICMELLTAAVLARFYWRELSPEDRDRWRRPQFPDEVTAAPLWAVQERLDTLIDRFEREAWYSGLQATITACPERGMSGQAAGMKVRTLCTAGRCLLTFEAEPVGRGESVTLITADDEAPYQRQRPGSAKMGPMGLQGIDATAPQAVSLLETALGHWREFDLRADAGVRVV